MKRLEKISWNPIKRIFFSDLGYEVKASPIGDSRIFKFTSKDRLTDKFHKIDEEGLALGANAYNEGHFMHPDKGVVFVPIQFYNI